MPDLLQSRVEIADLVHRYAFNVRTGKGLDCASLFIPDAEFEIREMNPQDPDSQRTRQRLVGRDAIVDYIVKSTSHGILVCPLIHNLLVEVEGDHARGHCMMTTRSWPAGYELVGEYQDSFRFQSRWLFESRLYTIYLSA